MKSGFHILDCTLRDGGYCNNWHFPDDLVRDYLSEMQKAGIKYVETGLRLVEKNKNLGNCAYCSDEFLGKFSIPGELEIAVMIKGEELITTDISKTLDRLFAPKVNSPVSLVRIAMPFQKAAKSLQIIETLKYKGYKVSLNLTKIHLESLNEFAEVINKIKNWQNFDILYFADTSGKFSPEDIETIINITRQNYSGPLGFHGHNNQSLALENSLCATKNGVSFIDSTVTGTGKGGGNLATEVLMREFGKGHDFNTLGLQLLDISRANIIYSS